MIQVTTLQEIATLARERRAVKTFGQRVGMPTVFGKARPAAFVINMSGHQILQLLTAGLYVNVKGCTCATPGDICPKCFEQIKEIPF